MNGRLASSALYGGSAVAIVNEAVANGEVVKTVVAQYAPHTYFGFTINELTGIVAAIVAILGLVGSLWYKWQMVKIAKRNARPITED